LDPPPEGCPLCGSTWGDWWQKVQGSRQFFCCKMCADQWVTMIDRVKAGAGWPRVDSINVEGNRWGRTCEAHYGEETFRFFVVFTPEGDLRRFDALESIPTVGANPTGAETTELEGSPPDEEASAVDPMETGEPFAEDAGPEGAPTEGAEDALASDPEPEDPTAGELHPSLVEQLAHEARDFPSLLEVPVDEGRQIVRKMVRETDDRAGEPPAVAMLKTSSFALPGHRVPVRVYLPTNGEEPFPVVVYFHGGGWVFGDLDTHDSVCREIANRSYCAVVSVAYRRSPEHKFPEPLEDCYGAVRWVSDPATAARLQIDPERIAVGGDSVGGTMAAITCVLARERGGPRISAQVLICPVTAYEPDTPSFREFATGFGLEASFLPWMWSQYLRGPADAADPHAVPMRNVDLSHLPPALVLTGECDLLRDEGEEYGERLRAAGVEAQITRYPRMPHGFLDYRGLVDEGWDALDEIGEMLRKVFGRDDAPPPQ
jgi:acetyl esterase/lipase